MNLTARHLPMSMPGTFTPSLISINSRRSNSVMYRKYKEHKDKEYEAIIKKQVHESKLIAEHEGITIPKTLDDYVAPSRAGAIGMTNGRNGKRSTFHAQSHDEDADLGIAVSRRLR